MDISMKINSDMVRELRNKNGWSQEQLSAVSGISLRTIQRIESEGNTSRETKVCLAATFDVELSALYCEKVNLIKTIDLPIYKPKKLILATGILAIVISILAYIFAQEPHLIFIIANMVSVSVFIYSILGWYFSESKNRSSSLRRTVRAIFIYISCYLAFALIGNVGRVEILNGIVSSLIFGVIYYFMDAKFNKNNSAHQA